MFCFESSTPRALLTADYATLTGTPSPLRTARCVASPECTTQDRTCGREHRTPTAINMTSSGRGSTHVPGAFSDPVLDDTHVVPRGHVARTAQAYLGDAGGDGSVRTYPARLESIAHDGRTEVFSPAGSMATNLPGVLRTTGGRPLPTTRYPSMDGLQYPEPNDPAKQAAVAAHQSALAADDHANTARLTAETARVEAHDAQTRAQDARQRAVDNHGLIVQTAYSAEDAQNRAVSASQHAEVAEKIALDSAAQSDAAITVARSAEGVANCAASGCTPRGSPSRTSPSFDRELGEGIRGYRHAPDGA